MNTGGPSDTTSDSVTITVLPGTKIHGKLTYKSVTEAQISPDAQVEHKEWIQTDSRQAEGFNYPIWILKTILTLGIFYTGSPS
ncbi:MAG: hypothetical protein PHE79_04070 [Eubacteriales bacterium]|nr:hypothetical protein [Eubacteriales bacterium]